MKKLQLIYFNLRALCEAPRMMLHQSNISYTYEMAWNYFKKPWKEVKQEVIFHRLPLLIVDEKIEIWQSNTISRYIANLTDNIPKDDVMAAYADSIFESAHDLFFPLNPTINIFTGDNHINHKKKLIEDILPRAFINFNKLIDKFEGNFFLGERAYYCDYNVFHHLSLALLIDENILNNYPKLNKFMIDFASQNGIKKYLDSRPQLVGIGIQPKVIIDEKQYATGTNPDYDYQ